MQTSTPNPSRNRAYAFRKPRCLVLLVLSPLLPYLLTMAYNSYLLIRLPAQIKSLPVLPDAELRKAYLRPDAHTHRCVELILLYKSDVLYDEKKTVEFYEKELGKQGWRKHSYNPSSGSLYFTKPTHSLEIFGITSQSVQLRMIFLVFPTFQLGCFQ